MKTKPTSTSIHRPASLRITASNRFPACVQQQVTHRSRSLRLRAATSDLRSFCSGPPSTTTPRDLDQIEVAEQLPNGDVKTSSGSPTWTRTFPRRAPSTSTPVASDHRLHGVKISMIEPLDRPHSLLEDQDNAAVVMSSLSPTMGNVIERSLPRARHKPLRSPTAAWARGSVRQSPAQSRRTDLQASSNCKTRSRRFFASSAIVTGAEHRDHRGAARRHNDRIADVVRRKRIAPPTIEDFMIAANEVAVRDWPPNLRFVAWSNSRALGAHRGAGRGAGRRPHPSRIPKPSMIS
jgi:hypothetical protein